eukprot:CAMPEP_0194198876 /NCGR_PEP_ID=MMETSP0156-20130528/94_1 /TAXON_ID=33649 /ORGANISM="Thalassionema nitzschioides, Strain L26-B" /LENGTH=187 /DNA_ID=CAMNT_0038923705 /DNA_START=83 /DNA_END=646 /DNA_ORIENTATION=+
MTRKKNKKHNSKGKTTTSQQRCGPKGAHQIAEGIYISGEHFAMQEEKLQDIGISFIVACGCQAHFPDKFVYKEIRLKDSSASSNVASNYLHPAADFIAHSLRHGAILVHCKAGICRSTTMIAAYLLKYSRDIAPTVADALMIIRKSRPCANPRPEFIKSLEKFLEQLSWQDELRAQQEQRECEEAEI